MSDRGGADVHLLGVVAHQAMEHEVHVAAGRLECEVEAALHAVPGLDSRTARPCDLGALEPLGAEVIHVHNVVNPWVLGWAADRGAVMTVQDHRAFCPGQGKLTRDGAVCREAMGIEVCAQCFDEGPYFHEILALTEARLAAVRRMRRVIVLSRYMRGELAAVGVQPISVIPPFVVGLEPQPAAGPPCVLHLGRLVRAKGLDDVVAAWRASGVDLPLVMVGTGPERGRIEAAGVAVTGWCDRAGVAGWLAAAQAVVMAPRWQEPFGIAGLEALHLGVPVAAWDSGGISEWHPAPVPYGDRAALAKALRDCVGQRTSPPHGFEAGPLMAALERCYLDGAGRSG